MASKSKVLLALILVLILAIYSFGCSQKTFDMFEKNAKDTDVDADDRDEKESEPTEERDVIEIDPIAVDPAQSGELKGWTIMLYLNGSDLESENAEATKNLVSLLSVDLPDDVHVLIYTGGTKKWQYDLIDPDQNQIWEVDDGEINLLESMEIKSIGESSTLAQFLTYGQTLYPGTRRAVFFWNHGGGTIQGFGADELFGNDTLLLAEIRDAFSGSYDGQKYDLVGFDACLMASVEMASILAPYAHYLVASEEIVPGGGWNYEYTFGAIAEQPQMDGLDFGIAITDGYYAKYEMSVWESITTCSVIDLGLIPAVEDALGDFASKLTADITTPENLTSVANARQRAEAYGEAPGQVPYDLVDLYNFVELQSEKNPGLSQRLMDAIEAAVVYEVSGSQRIYSYGLSVYFPFSAEEYFEYCIKIYNTMGFSFEYHQFIADFAANISDQTYLSYVPEYNPQIQELGTTATPSESDEAPLFAVQLTDEEMEYISYVYCALGWSINDRVVLDLGFDSDIYIDYANNTIYDDFDESWTGLNGALVSLYVMEETEEYVVYNVPVLYNGRKAIVTGSWIWDETNSEGGYYTYNGIFYTNDEFAAPNTKLSIELKIGDAITPTFNTLYAEDGQEGYYEGETFYVDKDGLYLGLVWLPDGDYYYGFLLVDSYGDYHYTEYSYVKVPAE